MVKMESPYSPPTKLEFFEYIEEHYSALNHSWYEYGFHKDYDFWGAPTLADLETSPDLLR